MDKEHFDQLAVALQTMTEELVVAGAIPLSDEEMVTLISQNLGVFYSHLPPIGFRAVVAILATLQSRS